MGGANLTEIGAVASDRAWLLALGVAASRGSARSNFIRKETTMILIREVFQAKYGQGDSMVALFKEAQGKWLSEMPSRLLVRPQRKVLHRRR